MISSDKAYQFILHKIVSGEYPPGMALVADTLSAEIGVSRTPVRDALRQLEKSGLVSILPHLGASVKRMDAKEYRDTCTMRMALEVFAAGLAATSRGDDDLWTIRTALENMRTYTERLLAGNAAAESFELLIAEDVRFHVAVIAASKNDVIKKEILRLHLIYRVVSVETVERNSSDAGQAARDREHRMNVLKEHEEIYQAIERRDPVAAKAAMERHIQIIVDEACAIFAQEQRPQPAPLTDEEKMYAGKV